MNVKIKNLFTKISGAVSKKVMIITIGGVVTVTAATVVGIKLHNKSVEKPVDVGAVAQNEEQYQAQQQAIKEQEEKKADTPSDKKDNENKEDKEEKKDTDNPSSNEDNKTTDSTTNSNSSSSASSSSNSSNSSTSSSSSNGGSTTSSNSNTNSSNTSKPSTSNPAPSNPTPTKPSRPSGYDASVTQRINADEMSGMGYYNKFSSADINKLISASISIANGNGMPENAKTFHHNGYNKDVTYTGHSLNNVFMGNEPARYYTQFKDVPRHYGTFDYAVAYWNSSKNGYDVKYVSIGY